jgi:hypothetical protein
MLEHAINHGRVSKLARQIHLFQYTLFLPVEAPGAPAVRIGYCAMGAAREASG